MLTRTILIGALLGVAFAFSPAGCLVTGMFIMVLLFIHRFINAESKKFLIYIFAAGLILRAILAMLNYNGSLFMHIGSDTQPDARVYNNNAFYVAQVVNKMDSSIETQKDPSLSNSLKVDYSIYKGALPRIPSYQNCFYVWLIGTIYASFGYSPIVVKILNGLFGCISAIISYLIALKIFRSEKVAKISAFLVMFFPSMLYWSATLLRDPLVNLIFLTYIFFVIDYLMRQKPYSLLLAFVSISAMSLFKNKMSVLLFGGFLLVLICGIMLYLFKKKSIMRWIGPILIIYFLVCLVSFNLSHIGDFVKTSIINVMNVSKSAAESPETLTYKIYKSSFYTTYETLPDDEVLIRSVLNSSLLFSLCKSLIYYFLSPFPWQIPYGHPFLLFFYPQTAITFIAIPFIFFGILASIRRASFVTAIILVLSAIIIIPQALAESVVGSVVRHRDMFTPLMIIFASYGFYLTFFPNEKKK